MKRAHRRWHRRLGWVLLPLLALTLVGLALTRHEAPENAALPPALAKAASAQGR